jgi:hypothetical protein
MGLGDTRLGILEVSAVQRRVTSGVRLGTVNACEADAPHRANFMSQCRAYQTNCPDGKPLQSVLKFVRATLEYN